MIRDAGLPHPVNTPDGPQEGVYRTPQERVRALYCRLPTGPNTAGLAIEQARSEPWAFSGEGETLTVYIPSNLEEVADDPLALVGIAAIKVLNPIVLVSHHKMTPVDHDKKVAAYLSGIAWALNEGDNKLPSYHNVSGAMGHGFYYACHAILRARLEAGDWWCRGTSWHFVKGMTGKAWSSDLDAVTRRISALVTKACGVKVLDNRASSWLRDRDSFIGHEISKTLPGAGSKILRGYEQDYLQHHFNIVIARRNQLLAGFSNPSDTFIKGLSDCIKELGQMTKPWSTLVDSITTHRMSRIYTAKTKAAKKKALGTPMETLIANLGIEVYLEAFDPATLMHKRAFKASDMLESEDPNQYVNRLQDEYNNRTASYRDAGLIELADLCTSFSVDAFVHRD